MVMTGYASVDKPWLKYYAQYLIEKDLPKVTMYDYILKGNNYYPKRVALNYFNNRITYSEMFQKIDTVARAFLEMGVKKGDIVTISMPTLPEFVYMFYALSKIGAIANMVDPRKSGEEIEEYVNMVGSKIFVIVDVALEKVKDIAKSASIEKIISVSPSESLPSILKKAYRLKNNKKKPKIKKLIKWEEFYNLGIQRKNEVIVDEFPEYEENRPVVIVYTGGTTGKSKGVVLSNDNLNAASFQCETCGYDFQRQHTWLNIMPPFIVYGVGNGLHLPLAMGMEVILIPQFDPNKFDRLLQKHHPNHVTGVPTHYDSIVKSKVIEKEGLKYLLSPIVGGDKLNEASEEIINKFFKKNNCNFNVSKGYGMSEVCAAVCTASIPEINEIGSVGIPFHHTIIAVFDPETGKELKYNEIGEICISGPNTMLGYYNNEDETNNIIRKHKDGLMWVHSGDLGYITERGVVHIQGRTKEMIVRPDGFKVFPILIEEVILSHANVKACKVVGVKDKNYSQGELPKAYIVLEKETDNENKLKSELKKICEERLAEYLQPIDFVIKSELPKTSIGKIDFMKLKAENE
ncbi:MAG: acyl--CoA ligase [Firmicutes bacterium]|nr:acyl--CoA ligase [Bacillota bacterium]